eukprot:TRINITY_DN2808_c0_g1_i1.p1 TRINITY_DN2808_c0_g1~~TRINITY_DN2808_c0_g1_i1.p1  ORF type:complete len:447 (-),score=119.72 TRINITY_DN2808_c0_g1_i1:258-1520(-)
MAESSAPAAVPKRRKVVNELHQTEKDYVTSLQALSWCFLKPLSQRAQTLPPEIAMELAALEPLVETIKSIHVVFLQDIKKAITASPVPAIAGVGPPFLQMANYLKTYKNYVGHYQKLVPLLAARKNDAAFVGILEGLKTKECKGHGLKDFLIMPIQRIPRYNMLIADLVKHTEEDSDDYGPLIQAKELVLTIAAAVEHTSVHAENSAKMMTLASTLLFNRVPKVKLLESHRKLLWDLDKVSTALPSGNDTGQLHLYVFNDLLLFTRGSPEEAVYTVFVPQEVLQWNAKDTQGGQGVMEIEVEAGLLFVTLPSKNLQELESTLDVKELDERQTVPVLNAIERTIDSDTSPDPSRRKRRGSLLNSISNKLGMKSLTRTNSESDMSVGPEESSGSPRGSPLGRASLKRTYSLSDAEIRGSKSK